MHEQACMNLELNLLKDSGFDDDFIVKFEDFWWGHVKKRATEAAETANLRKHLTDRSFYDTIFALYGFDSRTKNHRKMTIQDNAANKLLERDCDFDRASFDYLVGYEKWQSIERRKRENPVKGVDNG